MANELTLNASLAYEDAESILAEIGVEDFVLTPTTKWFTRYRVSVATSEQAISLGGVSSLGYAVFINRDTTNFIELRTGTGSTKFAKLKPNNGFAVFHFGTGVTAPYAIADTGACQMDVFICST